MQPIHSCTDYKSFKKFLTQSASNAHSHKPIPELIYAFLKFNDHFLNEASQKNDSKLKDKIRTIISLIPTENQKQTTLLIQRATKNLWKFTSYVQLEEDVRTIIHSFLIRKESYRFLKQIYKCDEKELVSFNKACWHYRNQENPPVTDWVCEEKISVENAVQRILTRTDKERLSIATLNVSELPITHEHLTRLLDACPNVKFLNISNCPKILDLNFLSSLTTLTSLQIVNSPCLRDFSILSKMPSLTHLYLSNCRHLDDFSKLATMTQLLSLTLRDCNLISLMHVAPLVNLVSLNISYSTLSQIAILSNFTSLKILKLEFCTNIREIFSLRNLVNLEELSLLGSVNIVSFNILSSLINLKDLNLSSCINFSDAHVLSPLTSLVTLNISNCRYLDSLEGLRYLVNLRLLDVTSLGRQVNVDNFTSNTDLFIRHDNNKRA